MRPAVLIRAARDFTDDGEIARIASAAFPDWPRTGAEVAAARERRGSRFHHATVVEAEAGLAAYGYIEVPDVAAAPGRIRIGLVTDPAHLGQGIGAVLYDALEAEARRHGATELVCEALDSHPRALPFAEKRGYAVYNARIQSRLHLDGIDTGRVGRSIDAHADHLFACGVRIVSYRQMVMVTLEAPRRLYELFSALWRDVPFGISGAGPTFEAFVAEELDDPAFRAAGSFIALDGDDWIGMCAQSAAPDHQFSSMTGVVPRWRRHGLARWLKLHAIRYALEIGAVEVRTANDAANVGILALNRELGYVPVDTDRRLRKALV